MNDYLLRYAIDNVWCNLTQDKQFVYQLRQLTPRYGVRLSYVVDYERYKLPTSNLRDYWHVYQIGQVLPSQLGIPKLKYKWMSLQDLANDFNLLCDVYCNNGIKFPKVDTYLLITDTQNLLIAVKKNDRLPDLDIESNSPYMHLYSNAYFKSERSDIANKRWMIVRSLKPNSTAEIRQFQIQLLDLLAEKGGYPQFFVNGRLVDEISAATASPGDNCEFILDPSIKKIVDLPINDLPVFRSTLDSQRKYILHYDDPEVKTIEFYDDVDMYLLKRGPFPNRFSGIYYHHNEGNWLRMLTHKDYSTPVDRIQEFIVQHPDNWTGIDDKTIRLYIRHSGYDRPLIADSSRIQELYRLKSQDIIRAMTGADAVNPIWRAENLEQCDYVKFMSASPKVIYPIAFQDPSKDSPGKAEAQQFAGDVFGYHSAADILAHNPTKTYVEQGSVYVDLAYNYWIDATVFEYDAKGILLGYHYHTGGKQYRVRSSDCTMVEAITGKGGLNYNGHYGLAPVDLSGGYNYRVYVTRVWGGVPTEEWVDITDLPNRHEWGFYDDTTDNPKWIWTADPMGWYGYVRRDNYFYLKEMSFNKSNGIIRFGLDNWENHNGELINKLLEIPFGQLDIFLNGRPLIENLDYRSIDRITVLNNLEYLVDGTNKVLVRGTGFCTPELKRYKPSEIGFVEYGVLSNNGIYDIHTHKMQRIIIDGHYKAREDVVFEEERNALVVQGERNGAPFQIQTPQVTFREVYKSDQEARVKDDIKDKHVSDYMTFYFGQRERDEVDSIPNHYVVYSSFANKILHDIVNGTLKPPFQNGRYSDMDIVNLLKSYEWLVPFDILNTDYNTNHVYVYPHWLSGPIGLDSFQYEFFVRIVKLYLQKPLNLAPFITITRT